MPDKIQITARAVRHGVKIQIWDFNKAIDLINDNQKVNSKIFKEYR